MGKTIGIDLGTTNGGVAVMEGTEPRIILNKDGARLTPSYVAYTDQGTAIVGEIAKRQAITSPTSTLYAVRRFIGRRFDQVGEEIERVSYEVERGQDGAAVFRVRGSQLAPPEVSAKVINRFKKAAEDHLGEKVTAAILSVPAYFDDAQRRATQEAGSIAGLDVKRLISEPVAVALAYGLGRASQERVAVCHFGGGTFGVSILEADSSSTQILSTSGDTHLGGDDVDRSIMRWLIAEFKKDTGTDVSNDKVVLQRLRDAAEKAKIELSSVKETEINLPFLSTDASGPKHIQERLSRSKLEQMIRPLIERSLEPVRRALADANKTPQQLDGVILVGGSTRIPLVRETLKNFFGKEPRTGLNPDEVVALGAAVKAGAVAGDG